MTATCFPITDGIEAASRGSSAAVRTLTEGVVEKPFMTWADLRRLLAAGWEIGGHTATHCKMAEKIEAEGEAGVVEEVRTSHALMERHLGGAPVPLRLPQWLAHGGDRPHSGGGTTGRCGCGTWSGRCAGPSPSAAPRPWPSTARTSTGGSASGTSCGSSKRPGAAAD